MKTGFIENEPMETYHGNWKIPSKSSLDLVLKSPRHFWDKYINPESIKTSSTRAQSFGTHAHTIILETDKFTSGYLCGPKGKNRNHVPFKDMVSDNPEKIVLPYSEYKALEALFKSVMSEPISKYLLSLEGKPEVSIYWKDPFFNQALKCRPDKLLSENKIVIDVKTTGNGSKFKFQRHACDLGYHRSAALTLRGLKEITGDDYAYIFLVVEVTPPFNVSAYSFDERSINFASGEIDRAITTLQDCQETKSWPGYPGNIEIINLPKWMIGENNE